MAEENENTATATMPYIINVRGGMSKKGIVRQIPPEMTQRSLDDAIQYATRSDQLKDDDERAIADSIKQEMKKTGKYIIVLNGVDSVTAEKIKHEILDKYMTPQSKDLENGEQAQYGYAELAVASVQEGGKDSLDKKL